MQEKRIHEAFQVSILLKGAHAIVECVGGLILALNSTDAIRSLVNRYTQDELAEDRRDLVAAQLLHWAQGFSVQSKHFYAIYLLSHGVV